MTGPDIVDGPHDSNPPDPMGLHWPSVENELVRSGFLVVTKVGATLPMSAEVYPVRVESERDRAYANAVAKDRWRERRTAEQVAYADLWSALLDVGYWSRPIQAVLDLHHPVDDHPYGTMMVCAACWDGDMDRAQWPCRTVTAVADAYGIGIPEAIA